MAMNHFTFNGHSTADFGLLVTGLSTYGAPGRRVERVSVPGRNGDVLLDDGTYDNYIARYEIVVGNSFKANAREIANWLLGSSGYSNLTDTYNPESYRKAAFYSSIDYVVTALARYGSASIEFDCKPQRYRTTNADISVAANASVTLNFDYNAEPIIQANATGSFTINGTTMTVTAAPVVINTQTMQCYYGSTLMNDKVEGDFPKMVKGANTVSSTMALTITPNYWEL